MLQGVRSDALDMQFDTHNFYGVQKIEEDKWYQLRVAPTYKNKSNVAPAELVLVQVRDYKTGELYLKVVPQTNLETCYTSLYVDTNPTLNSSLWKIQVVDKHAGAYMYKFINKETGYAISYNCADAYHLDENFELTDKDGNEIKMWDAVKSINKSDIDSWRWYTVDENMNGILDEYKMYTFNHDKTKVIGLSVNKNLEVTLVDAPARMIGSYWDVTVPDIEFLTLQVVKAGARVLTASDLNSMIDADGWWMNAAGEMQRDRAKFKGAMGDLTSGYYKAEDTKVAELQAKEYKNEMWAGYQIVLRHGENEYFGVEADSTYEYDKLPSNYASLVVKNRKLDWNPGSNRSLKQLSAFEARYHWKVTYYPTQDSLVFEPLNASIINDAAKQAGIMWGDTKLAEAAPEEWYNTVNETASHSMDDLTENATGSHIHAKSAYVPVALVDINNNGEIDNKAVLTVGKPANAAIGDERVAMKKFGRPVVTDVQAQMGVKIQFDHTYTYLTRATLDNGLYFIQVKVANDLKKDYRKDGMNLVYNMWGQMMYDNQDDYQNYEHMPATQWVVERDDCENGTPYVTIRNREYGSEQSYAFYGQLYTDKNGNMFTINHRDYNYKSDNKGKFDTNMFSCGDTLKFFKITDKAITENGRLGYKHFDDAKLKYETWGVKYSNANTYGNLNTNNYLNINDSDDLLVIKSEQWKDFEVDPIKDYGFGYAGAKAGLADLRRTVYTLKVRDNNLIDNGWQYVVVKDDENGNPYYQTAHLKDVDGKNIKLGTFYFKADQITKTGDTAYVFVDATGWDDAKPREKEKWPVFTGVLENVNPYDYQKVYPERMYYGNGFKQIGVKTQTAKTTYVTLDTDPETVNDAFVFVQDNRPLYMPIGVDVSNGEMNTITNIFRKRGNAGIAQAVEYLFEDGNNQSNITEGSYIKNFGYLGITAADNIKPVGEKSTTALYVDSVISSNPRMPQYLFMVDVDSVKDGRWCNTNEHGYFPTLTEADAKDKTHHVFYNGYVAGRVLVNLNDSVLRYSDASINMMDQARKFAFRNYTRLGFVEGIHMYVDNIPEDAAFNVTTKGEYLFLLNGGLTLKDLMTTVGDYPVIDADKFNKALANGMIKKNVLDGNHKNYAFSLRYIDDDHKDVLLESQSMDGDAYIGTFRTASWVQIMDGVPVLAQSTNINGDHTSIDGNVSLQQLITQAQIFNVGKTDDIATSNENITTEGVKVITGEGFVTIKGAAGKAIAITNILGQTVSKIVANSDDVQVAAPAGIIVVAVEGETAQKAIVK